MCSRTIYGKSVGQEGANYKGKVRWLLTESVYVELGARDVSNASDSRRIDISSGSRNGSVLLEFGGPSCWQPHFVYLAAGLWSSTTAEGSR